MDKYCRTYGIETTISDVTAEPIQNQVEFFDDGFPFVDLALALNVAERNMFLYSTNISQYPSLTCTICKTTNEKLMCYGISGKHSTTKREAIYAQLYICRQEDVRNGDPYLHEILGQKYLTESEIVKSREMPSSYLFRDNILERIETKNLKMQRRKSLSMIVDMLCKGKDVIVRLPESETRDNRSVEVLKQLFELIPPRHRCEISFSTNRDDAELIHLKDIRLLIVGHHFSGRGSHYEIVDLDGNNGGEEPNSNALAFSQIDLVDRRAIEKYPFKGNIYEDYQMMLMFSEPSSYWWREEKSIQKIIDFKDLIEKHNSNIVFSIQQFNDQFIEKIPGLIDYPGGINRMILDFMISGIGEDNEKEMYQYLKYCIDKMKRCGLKEDELNNIWRECMDIKKMNDNLDDLKKNVEKINENGTTLSSSIQEWARNFEKGIAQLISDKNEIIEKSTKELIKENMSQYKNDIVTMKAEQDLYIQQTNQAIGSTGSQIERLDESIGTLNGNQENIKEALQTVNATVNSLCEVISTSNNKKRTSYSEPLNFPDTGDFIAARQNESEKIPSEQLVNERKKFSKTDIILIVGNVLTVLIVTVLLLVFMFSIRGKMEDDSLENRAYSTESDSTTDGSDETIEVTTETTNLSNLLLEKEKDFENEMMNLFMNFASLTNVPPNITVMKIESEDQDLEAQINLENGLMLYCVSNQNSWSAKSIEEYFEIHTNELSNIVATNRYERMYTMSHMGYLWAFYGKTQGQFARLEGRLFELLPELKTAIQRTYNCEVENIVFYPEHEIVNSHDFLLNNGGQVWLSLINTSTRGIEHIRSLDIPFGEYALFSIDNDVIYVIHSPVENQQDPEGRDIVSSSIEDRIKGLQYYAEFSAVYRYGENLYCLYTEDVDAYLVKIDRARRETMDDIFYKVLELTKVD